MSMHDIEEENATRHRIKAGFEKQYITITAKDIMFSGPNEGDIRNQDDYSLKNALCRMISRYMDIGGTWEDVERQLTAANITANKTFVRDVAQIIREEHLA